MEDFKHVPGVTSSRNGVSQHREHRFALRQLPGSPCRRIKIRCRNYMSDRKRAARSRPPKLLDGYVRLLLVVPETKRQRFQVREHTTPTVEHGVFVGEVDCSGSNEGGDKRRLSGVTAPRYDDRPTSPAYNSGVDKNSLLRVFSDLEAHRCFESLE